MIVRGAVLPGIMVAAVGVLVLTGCGRTRPPMVAASGTVTLGGKPLPKVRLEFTPTFPGFGGELFAIGEAGDDGVFRPANGVGAGICAGSYKVTIHEMPPPAELQEYRMDTPARQKEYYAKLANRPIPERYGALTSTPVEVTIEPGTTDFVIALER